MGKLEKGRCGLCCTLLVRLTEQDIKRIKALGFEEGYFVATGSRGREILNRINGYCRFLEVKDGIASCTIYSSRPKVCRDYVCIKRGEQECGLQRHYSVVDMEK